MIKKKELIETFGSVIGEKIFNVLESDVSVDTKLEYCNQYLNGYGIEPITGEFTWVNHYYQNIIALYVNLGDTYTTTIVYDTERGKFLISSWGDFYESSNEYKEYQKNYNYD